MKGIFIPDITAEMFRNGCLESIEALMAEGEVYDIEYEPEPQWIPCTPVTMPEEDNWLGGLRRKFSERVLVSVLNSADEDEWVDVSQTIDGEWVLELPRHCKVVAWMPLPEPYQEEGEHE